MLYFTATRDEIHFIGKKQDLEDDYEFDKKILTDKEFLSALDGRESIFDVLESAKKYFPIDLYGESEEIIHGKLTRADTIQVFFNDYSPENCPDSPIHRMYYYEDIPKDERGGLEYTYRQEYIKGFGDRFYHMNSFLHARNNPYLSNDLCKEIRLLGFSGVHHSDLTLCVNIDVTGVEPTYILGVVEDGILVDVFMDKDA